MGFDLGYAVLIGTGQTQSKQFSPLTVGNDIQALQKILVDPGLCGYPAANVVVLQDETATAQEINKKLAWLKKVASENRAVTVVFYYSGHGWVDADEHYHLIQYDVDDEALSETAYAASTLMERLRAIQAKQMVVIFDCCHAGGVGDGKGEAAPIPKEGMPSAPPKTLQSALSEGAGRVVFSSSLDTEKSWMHPVSKLSLFTHHLLEALQGAECNPGETEVSVGHLITYVDRMVQRSAQEMGRRQTPYFELKGENFPLALVQGGKGLGPGGWQAQQATAQETIKETVRSVQINQTAGAGSAVIAGDVTGTTITINNS